MDVQPSLVYYQTHNPFRTPDWRWQRAHQLHTSGATLSRRRDDIETITAARFLAVSTGGRPTKTPSAHACAAIAGARAFQEEGTTSTWEIQARLLAGQTDNEIAPMFRVEPETIQWFEALFFNVRDHLHHRDWIAARVLGPGLRRGFRPDELGKVWQAFAYFGGIKVLEIVLAATLNRPLPNRTSAPAGRDPRLHAVHLRLSARLAVAARMLQTRADAAAMRALVRAKQRLEQTATGGPTPKRDTLGTMFDLLAGIEPRQRPARSGRPRTSPSVAMPDAAQRLAEPLGPRPSPQTTTR